MISVSTTLVHRSIQKRIVPDQQYSGDSIHGVNPRRLGAFLATVSGWPRKHTQVPWQTVDLYLAVSSSY